jgi:hypothetical protein
MAPQELNTPEVYSIGIRAEVNACEPYSDHASRVPTQYLQQKNQLLARDKLRQKRILKEVKRSELREVPPAPQAALAGENILI